MKENSPIVTVLMPVFNGEKYVQDAIESILSQTYKDFEFLIIDDGSTDKSATIINSYNDDRIRLVHNEVNSGLPVTLNKGIKLARGRYIVRMDCDDISMPKRVETQFHFMEENTRVAVCGSWVSIFGSNYAVWKFPLRHNEIHSQLLFSSCIAHPSVIMRRASIIENNLYYDETFVQSQDYELWIRIAKKYEMANIGEVLLMHRVHDDKVGKKHKFEQIKYADVIRYRQIARLGINATKDEIGLHRSIGTYHFETTQPYVSNARQWLERIYNANIHYHYYPDVELRRELARRWLLICRNAIFLGPWVARVFLGSPLSKYAGLNTIQKTVLVAKSIIKWKQKTATH